MRQDGAYFLQISRFS